MVLVPARKTKKSKKRRQTPAQDVEGDGSFARPTSVPLSMRSRAFSLTPYRRSGTDFQWSDYLRKPNVDSRVGSPSMPLSVGSRSQTDSGIQTPTSQSSLGEYSGGSVSGAHADQLDDIWDTINIDGQLSIFKMPAQEHTTDIAEDIPILQSVGFFIDYPNGVLGMGQYGTVYRGYFGTDVEDFERVGNIRRFAVKVMDFSQEMSDSHKESFETEKYILTKLEHRNIVAVINIVHIGEHHFLPFEDYQKATYMTPDRAYLFMEYADGGTIGHWISRNFQNWEPSTRIRFITGLFSGMRHLHKNNIFHSDVHVGNVLLFTEANLLVAKWADFGMSKIADALQYRERIPEITIDMIKHSCGSDIIRMFNIFERILFMRKPELETQQEKYQFNEFEKMIKIKDAESIEQIYQQFSQALEY